MFEYISIGLIVMFFTTVGYIVFNWKDIKERTMANAILLQELNEREKKAKLARKK